MTLDPLAAYDALVRPVLTLHEHVWRDPLYELLRGVFTEGDDGVHGLERGQHLEPVLERVQRALLTLQAAHALVVVDPDEQDITLRLGEAQVLDVPAVQDVEAAVGEDDVLSFSAPLLDELIEVLRCQDLAPRRLARAHASGELFPGERGCAEATHDDACRLVGELHSVCEGGARAEMQRELRDDRVASARDVVDGARLGGDATLAAVGGAVVDPAGAERDHDSLDPVLFGEDPRSIRERVVVRQGAPERELGLVAVR